MTVTITAIPRSVTNSTVISLTAVAQRHESADTEDPQYVLLTNSVAYRYYALKIADGQPSCANLAFRRVVLQTSDHGSPPTYTSQYPPAHNSTYVKATSSVGNYSAYYATDPAKSVTGAGSMNAWAATSGTNNRFHIDLGSAKTIERIYYVNFHDTGAGTFQGIRTFTVWGSNTAGSFADLVYGNDNDWVQIQTTYFSGGTTRFFPLTTSTKPITGYAWTYGDNSDTGTTSCPTHTYPRVTTFTTYDVTVVLTYADGSNESSGTISKFISLDIDTNIPVTPQENSIVSVFLYNATSMMMVHRVAWAGSSYYLFDPKITNSLDVMGSAIFSLVDTGNSTVTERGLIVEGTNVLVIMGKAIVFSGTIRRSSQDLTNSFLTTTKLLRWNIECDSDLAKLKKTNVDPSVFTANGAPLFNTVGKIARTILTSSPDIRGVIDCTGNAISYQLNSANESESVGNQYDHIMSLSAQTNYDLRTRPSYYVYGYLSFNGSTVFTVGDGVETPSFTTNEFANMYFFHAGRTAVTPSAFWTDIPTIDDRFYTSSSKFAVGDRVRLTTNGSLPLGVSSIYDYYVIIVGGTYVKLSRTPGGTKVVVTTNGSGSHYINTYVDTGGVSFYGKVASNTSNTITLTTPVGVLPSSGTGYFILYRGIYSVDFLMDVSQPTAVRNLYANSTCFDYNDNDDKRKLSTKIVTQGKDYNGKSISVSVSAVHAYNVTRQFFNDSTYVTKPSEGYIYKNSYAPDATPVTVYAGFSNAVWYFGGTPYNYQIIYSSGGGVTALGTKVFFTKSGGGTLPSPLNAGAYYIVESAANYCVVSDTVGGSPIYLSGGSGTWYMQSMGGMWVDKLTFAEGDYLTLSGTTCPTGAYFGSASPAVRVVKSGQGGFFGWDITSTGTNVWVHKTSNVVNPGYTSGQFNTTVYVWLYGWGYIIPSGTVMAIISGTTAITVIADSTGGYAKTEEVSESGVLLTKITISAGSTAGVSNMFHGDQNFAGKGFLMSPRLYVENYNYVGANEVLIGEEKVTITAVGNDNNGNYIDVGTATNRLTSSTKKCYPHGVGALVARTNYTEASPEPGSAVALYGLHIDTRIVDSNITYGTLDAYSACLLLGFGNFWKKATVWCPLEHAYILQVGQYYKGRQTSGSTPITVGDNISVSQFSGGNQEWYEVVEATIVANEGRMILVLGDYEKNAYTSLLISTNAINKTIT